MGASARWEMKPEAKLLRRKKQIEVTCLPKFRRFWQFLRVLCKLLLGSFGTTSIRRELKTIGDDVCLLGVFHAIFFGFSRNFSRNFFRKLPLLPHVIYALHQFISTKEGDLTPGL